MPSLKEQLEAEYREAFVAKFYGMGTDLQNQLLQKESRALSASVGNAGGYTAPQSWATAIFNKMADLDPVRRVATVVSTQKGSKLHLPTADDSANEGAIFVENTLVDSSGDPTFGDIVLQAYKYSSKIVRVPVELHQDKRDIVEGYLTEALGKRVAKIQNKHFTTGTGSNQPTGVVTAATLGKTGANGQTTSVTYDDLVDLVYSIDPAYRQNASFMFNDTAAKVIRKLKDTAGQPIWKDNTLLGYPVTANNNMASMAASAKSILFGDFSQYVIFDVAKIEINILSETYADMGQIGVVAFIRSDANLRDTAAVKYYANSAT